MSDPTCVRCDRPTPDGYADASCGIDRPARQLADIADMTPAARDIAHGFARRTGGGGSGKPGSRLPIDLGATARLDAVQGTLTTWARHIAETRQGATWVHFEDAIVEASAWLAGQLEWMRHRREVGEFLEDVDRCARVVRGLARGPAEQQYLGPCGAEVLDDVTQLVDGGGEGIRTYLGRTCDGDVYAPRGARTGRCRTCGAEVATGEREAWLDGEVRGHAFRAAHIADAYGIHVKTIRTWHARGQLAQHGEDHEGRPLFNVGDVLDLAAAAAARRETERAKRERRAADRAAESEEDAA